MDMDDLDDRLREIEEKQTRTEIHRENTKLYEKSNLADHKLIYDKLEHMTGMLHVQKGFLKGILWILGIFLSLFAIFHDYFISK